MGLGASKEAPFFVYKVYCGGLKFNLNFGEYRRPIMQQSDRLIGL